MCAGGMNRIDRMACPRSHFLISQLAQQCQVLWRPTLEVRDRRSVQQFATPAHRDKAASDARSYVLIGHSAQQLFFGLRPGLGFGQRAQGANPPFCSLRKYSTWTTVDAASNFWIRKLTQQFDLLRCPGCVAWKGGDFKVASL